MSYYPIETIVAKRLQKRALGPGIINMVDKYLPRFDKLVDIINEVNKHGYDFDTESITSKEIKDTLNAILGSKDYDNAEDLAYDISHILTASLGQLRKELEVAIEDSRYRETIDILNRALNFINNILISDINNAIHEMATEYEKVLYRITHANKKRHRTLPGGECPSCGGWEEHKPGCEELKKSTKSELEEEQCLRCKKMKNINESCWWCGNK